ncbi:nucleotidyltransferase domain-containing protein [Calothrix sp. NIES-3974]|uniref:nucleotidyltransferase domain-containing protein n=1 Tax=Calothrix sp. NIES-3974 TaxID=2005462 RepID=UPI000B5FB7BB|nr:nucleotidyltransferase domain-containing protein [Calothrix sp. NIES-3974]BAZ06599.1 Kanamycin nucleotidyltransferase [Calothrix sp. NIES-3974]
MFLEPKPTQQIDRLNLADQIIQRILTLKEKQVIAIGLYGSLARGTDQLYSDIEIKCILNTEEEDYSWEWIEDGCKIEINFESEDVILN